MSRCLYNANIEEFLKVDNNLVLATLLSQYHGYDYTTTREAWEEEIKIMKSVLLPFIGEKGEIIFEYDIPRLGKRIDVVLLLAGIIFCLEFKVNKLNKSLEDVDQVLDYALDLKNFHKFSEDRIIVPILVPTNYKTDQIEIIKSAYNDKVINPIVAGKSSLTKYIKEVLEKYPNESPLQNDWRISPYSPTPTIIEAAKTLYKNHSVDNITRHEADKAFTDRTINCILNIIQKSKKNNKKSICFVTGVPGAGKTLVGLDVAIKQTYQGNEKPVENEGAVYLSGNGPLVAVLSEALAQDNYKNCREKGEKKKLTDSRR